MITATTIALAGLAVSAAGTYASYEQGQNAAKAQENQANYEAGIAHNNEIMANNYAAQQLALGKQQEVGQAEQGYQLTGSEKAALAGHGVDVNSGSAVDTISSQTGINTLDQLTTRTNSQNQAQDYINQGANFNAQAALDAQTASNAKTAGNVTAVSSALAGAGSVANKWYSYASPKSPYYNAAFDPSTWGSSSGSDNSNPYVANV